MAAAAFSIVRNVMGSEVCLAAVGKPRYSANPLTFLLTFGGQQNGQEFGVRAREAPLRRLCCSKWSGTRPSSVSLQHRQDERYTFGSSLRRRCRYRFIRGVQVVAGGSGSESFFFFGLAVGVAEDKLSAEMSWSSR